MDPDGEDKEHHAAVYFTTLSLCDVLKRFQSSLIIIAVASLWLQFISSSKGDL